MRIELNHIGRYKCLGKVVGKFCVLCGVCMEGFKGGVVRCGLDSAALQLWWNFAFVLLSVLWCQALNLR